MLCENGFKVTVYIFKHNAVSIIPTVAEVTAVSERVELTGNPQQLTAFLKHLCG